MTSGRPTLVPTVGLRSLTNGDGQFNAAGIAPGTYRVAATPPDRFGTFTVWSFWGG